MSGHAITIYNTTVRPGERKLVNLPIASLYTHTGLFMPVHVVNGRRPGPRLFISAAIHGDELNGVEIIRRVLKSATLKNLRGTLIAIPIVNMFGIIQHSRYLPDRRDLNRSFPGSSKGSLAARLAYIFVEEIVKRCTHGIDLHTGALHRSNLPQIRGNLKDDETMRIAKAFGVPVLLNSDLRDGSLREIAAEQGIPILLYEAGEALRFDELCIRAGVSGVLSVMRTLGMLRQTHRKHVEIEPFVARATVWERAPHSGIIGNTTPLGARVKKGDLLGVIHDPSDMFDVTVHEIFSRFSGIIIGRTNLPLVNEGDGLFHIARFEDINEAAAGVEAFQQEAESSDAFMDEVLIM